MPLLQAGSHSLPQIAGLLALGAAIGLLSGMLGIGGGVLVIPGLMFLFGFSQTKAVGTSLGMLLPPIGIFAFLSFYRRGNVDLPAAGLMAFSFAVGAWGGSRLLAALPQPDRWLRPLFAFFMLYVAGNMLFRSDGRVAAVLHTQLKTGLLIVGFFAAHLGMRRLGKRWEQRLSIAEIYRERLERPLPPDYEI